MAAQFYPSAKSQFVGINGKVLSSGKIEFYYSLTGTAAITYTDSIKSGRNEHPVPLDAAGKADIYLDPGVYTIITYDSDGVVVDSINNYEVVAPSTGGGGGEGNVPNGGIIMYSGLFSDIPSGWQLCDGTSPTPDLNHKFIRGTTIPGEIGDEGGSDDATIVAHHHSIDHVHTGKLVNVIKNFTTECTNNLSPGTRWIAGGETDFVFTGDAINGCAAPQSGVGIKMSSSDAVLSIDEYTGDTGDTGGTGVDKNMPVYYTLAYIMKVPV